MYVTLCLQRAGVKDPPFLNGKKVVSNKHEYFSRMPHMQDETIR